MTQYICKLTLERLCAKNIIKEEDREIYLYGLELLIATIFKGLVIVIIGALTSLIKEMLIFTLFFSGLRIQAGGYHAKTILGCLIGTLTIIFTSITVVRILPEDYQSYYILISMVASIVLIFLYAPLESENKPLSKEEKILYRHRSLQTVIIGNIIILILIAFSDKFNYLGSIASTGFFIESLTIIHNLKDKK